MRLFALLFCLCSYASYGQLTVNTNVNTTQMGNNISGSGVITSNVTINCSNGAYGTFDGTNANVGIPSGVLLTTGLADSPPGCVFNLQLEDQGSDGWACGQIDIYVDGVLVASGIENSQWGFTTVPIIVQDGQTLAIEYVNNGGPGCDSLEHSFSLQDDNFNTLVSGGVNYGQTSITPGQLYSGQVTCNPNGFSNLWGAPGPNDENTSSWNWGVVINDPDLIALEPQAVNDVCIMEFDIIPSCDTLQINYVFASEEYLDFVCSNFNDAFGFFISGPGINGPFSNGAENIAVLPGTNDFVGINTVNDGSPTPGTPCTTLTGANCPCNSAYYVHNGEGGDCFNTPAPTHCTDSTVIRYDGMTVPLTAISPVIPCSTYHMKIIIADAFDSALDSGVFLTYQGLSCPNGSSININMLQDTIIEGCLDGAFEMIRDGDSTGTLDVQVQVVGSATPNVDYTAPPTTISFVPLDTIETVTIPGLFDGVAEGVETIQVVLTYPLCGGTLVNDTIDLWIMDEPELSFTTTPEDCGQCNGDATVTMGAGSTAPYTYQWNAAAANQTTQTASALCSGTFAVTVTDANGCTATDSTSVTAVGGPGMTLVITDETCGGLNDGTITVTPVGAGPYDIALNGNVTGTNNFNNLAPGNYTISVIDVALGCQTDSVVVVVAGPCCMIPGVTGIDASCNALCDGSATASQTNGVGNISYNWLDDTGAAIGQTTATATNLCAGTYYVDITDSLCTIQDTIVITEPAAMTLTVSDTIICIGGTATFTANAANGTMPYTYNWQHGPVTQTIVETPIAPIDYIVVATDANGCLSPPDTASVQLYPPIFLTVSNDTAICEGEVVNLSTNVIGGQGAPYNYAWTDNLGTGWTGAGDVVQVTPTTTTTYYVVVTDNCETLPALDSITVTVTPTPQPQFTADQLEGCTPLEVNFTNTTDPALIGTCNWTFGNAGTTSNICDPTETFSIPGCYDITLEVTSPTGCVGDTTVTDMICVYGYPTPDFSWFPDPASILDPQVDFTNTTIDGVTYSWTFDSLGTSTDENPSFLFPDIPATYEVCLVASSGFGCTDTICYDVVVNDVELIFVPNAFTPGSDGVNDVFAPVLNFQPQDYEFSIYDRWGQQFFRSETPGNGWDGVYLGKEAPVDVYVWKLLVTDSEGQKQEYYGHVTLVR